MQSIFEHILSPKKAGVMQFWLNMKLMQMVLLVSGGLAIVSTVINSVVMTAELYSWYKYWNDNNFCNEKYTTSIQISSQTQDTAVIIISDFIFQRGDKIINASVNSYPIEGERLVNPNIINTYSIMNNVNYILDKQNTSIVGG